VIRFAAILKSSIGAALSRGWTHIKNGDDMTYTKSRFVKNL
jgi:hypothetical protein